MLVFTTVAIEKVGLIMDPQFWDIVARGVQNSNQWQTDLEANGGETMCFALYQRQGIEDGNLNINLGAWQVEEMRIFLEMRKSERAYLERQTFLK